MIVGVFMTTTSNTTNDDKVGLMMILGFSYINGLVQDCSNSIANALELLQSCAKASIYTDRRANGRNKSNYEFSRPFHKGFMRYNL